MNTETAPATEQRPGFLAQLWHSCLGHVVGLIMFVAFALLGWPIADAVGIPAQKGKDSLLVYGLIGMAAGALVVIPVWFAVKWFLRRRRQEDNKQGRS